MVVWPKHFSLGARPRIHMHRHILVYVRSALMSIISSFWIMLNYCSVGGALVPIFFFTGTRSRVPIQVVFSWSCTQLHPRLQQALRMKNGGGATRTTIRPWTPTSRCMNHASCIRGAVTMQHACTRGVTFTPTYLYGRTSVSKVPSTACCVFYTLGWSVVYGMGAKGDGGGCTLSN